MPVCVAVRFANEVFAQVDGVQARGVRLKYGSRRREDRDPHKNGMLAARHLQAPFYHSISCGISLSSDSISTASPVIPRGQHPRLFGAPHDIGRFEPSSG